MRMRTSNESNRACVQRRNSINGAATEPFEYVLHERGDRLLILDENTDTVEIVHRYSLCAFGLKDCGTRIARHA